MTGRRIAVIGAGPAGLSCAHYLARLGHNTEIFEARPEAGGLNTYGIARYKLHNTQVQEEIDFILGIGGIQIHYGKTLGKDIHLEDIHQQFDAVFLATGLQSPRSADITQEHGAAITDALSFVRTIRTAESTAEIPVPDSAVVIGAGNTAIDVACQLKRLGCNTVTLAYRRGYQQMSATAHELEIARRHEVHFQTWARPEKIHGQTKVTGITLQRTCEDRSGNLADAGEVIHISCDAVFSAVGQTLETSGLETLLFKDGKIATDESCGTSVNGIFAGGDCSQSGQDLTVEAVQQGKTAAQSIHSYLNSTQCGDRK